MESNHSLRLQPFIHLLLLILLIGILLNLGKSIFIPLSFSLLISFLLYPICQWMESKGTPRALAIGANLLGLTVLLLGITYLLVSQFAQFASDWPVLKSKLTLTYDQLQRNIESRTGITLLEQDAWLKETMSGSSGNFLTSIKDLLYASIINLVLLILVPIFAGLVLYTRERWVHVLYLLFPRISRNEIKSILKDTIGAYYNFFKGMGIVYLIVALLNSLGLWILGIPHALLFGVIASVLTFIPYVGIVVASLLPITISWLTYDSVWYPIGVIAIFTFVQYLEANLIFPLAVSSRLSINTFITIIVILAGGIIWGAAGMILFIPFIAILKLVADRTEKLKTIAMILGNGKVD